MPVAPVEVLPAARREIQAAFDWYFDRSPRAASAFAREIDRAMTLVHVTPGVWPAFEAGTRRYVLRRFPFDLIYREVESRIQVVAVAHHKRRPRYWSERLDPAE